MEIIKPDQKPDPAYYFYPQALGANLHPTVKQLLDMSNAELANRYCERHSEADEKVLIKLMNSTAKFFRWAGADLIRAVDLAGREKMIVIEMNSCPSGTVTREISVIFYLMNHSFIYESFSPFRSIYSTVQYCTVRRL